MNTTKPTITRVDFVSLPTQDVERATAFYRDLLGLAEAPATLDSATSSEFDLGGTTLSVWDPTSVGRPFQPNTNAVALHTDDVPAFRAQLEAAGVPFVGETIDTGVCHMAIFADPSGNPLMLHGRYVPRD